MIAPEISVLRYVAAVEWEVLARDPNDGNVHLRVRARSAAKALRTARRAHPVYTPISAQSRASRPTSAGALLAVLPEGVDHRCKGWTVVRFSDGSATVERGRTGVMLPGYVAAELRTVGDAMRLAVAALDVPMLVALAADVLLHGVVLSAPAQHPRPEATHATVGAHPDNRGGYACVTDPGAVPIATRDRSAFDAALRFVDVVGPAGCARAIDRAREAAGA